MQRLVRVAVSAIALLAPVAVVQASGDYSCDPVWKLSNGSYGCNNTAVLAPGNDSRVNLFYLLRDRQGLGTAGLSYPPSSDEEDLGSGHNFLGWSALGLAFYRQDAVDAGQSADHYGSRCISVTAGDAPFGAAMRANRGVPAAELAALVSARAILGQTCNAPDVAGAAPVWPVVASASGREYLGYLRAANAFYVGEWEGARRGFSQLKASRDPWLAETAAYMLPRTELNAAQAAAFEDDYGYFAGPAKVDKPALARAQAGFADYLKRYAAGRYADSAQGLVRRALWLGGDVAGLSREYERLLAATPAAKAGALELVQEIDNKLLTTTAAQGAVDGPLLLATIDLMMMRPSESEPGDTANAERPAVITLAQIAAQEPRFAGRADLFGFVQANHAFYVAKDPRRVLQLLPDNARAATFTPVQFSRQVLRGQALAALKDRNEAGFWREMLNGATGPYQRPVIELGLALNWERAGKLADVFAVGSPIGDRSIREILLINVAGADLLRAQAKRADRPQHERDVAVFTLLQKQLQYGDYAGFLADVALARAAAPAEGGMWSLQAQRTIPVGVFRTGAASDGYPCAPLAKSVAALARNPRDPKALLCLGDFYRIKGFDDYGRYSTAPKPDELGGSATAFRGRMTPRAGLYDAVIADPAAGPNEKAYALYRAVNCYAPNGNNSCGGTDVPTGQRQAWFQRLKRDYPASEWAKTLRYYW
ncbi:MAG: hypothetical protein ABIQ81_01920 [Novosphingobium sp.]